MDVFILALLQVQGPSYWPEDCCSGPRQYSHLKAITTARGPVTGPMCKHPFLGIFTNHFFFQSINQENWKLANRSRGQQACNMKNSI